MDEKPNDNYRRIDLYGNNGELGQSLYFDNFDDFKKNYDDLISTRGNDGSFEFVGIDKLEYIDYINNDNLLGALERIEINFEQQYGDYTRYIVLSDSPIDHIAVNCGGEISATGKIKTELSFTYNDKLISEQDCFKLVQQSGSKGFECPIYNDVQMQDKLDGFSAPRFDGIAVDGYPDTWSTVDTQAIGGDTYHLLSNDTRGGTVQQLIVNSNGKMIADNVSEGFEDDNYNKYFSTPKVDFDSLHGKLNARGLLPEDYFNYDNNANELGRDDLHYSNKVDFGGSEGIYIDLYANDKHFATGKTLADTPEAFMQQSQLGATMQMSLNGNDTLLDTLSQSQNRERESLNSTSIQIRTKEDTNTVGRNFTQDQLARAKTVNLLNYVDSHGYQTKKHGNTIKLVEGEHDSTLIFPETNTWCDMSTGVGGDTVSFLTKHEGKNMVSAVHELIGETFNPQNLFVKEAQQKREESPVSLPPKADDNKRAYAYLIKTRGLDRDIVDANIKNGNIYQSKEQFQKGDKTLIFNNCVFVGKDQDDKPQYASQRSMNDSSGYNFKADVANSKKEFGFLLKGSEKAEWLTVCESPIDALSVATLNKMRGENEGDEHILSLGGVSDKAIDKFLSTNPNIKVINIALDNDEAGRNAGERIKEKYSERGFNIIESYPKLKDYNLDLIRAHIDNQKPSIDAPPPAVNNNRAFMFLTTTKNIDAELVSSKIDNGDIYQNDNNIRTLAGEEKTVSNTVFAKRDAQGSIDYAISVGYNTSTEKADFKTEYYNDQNEHNYLSTLGSNDELLVFNNPISMLTHQNFLSLSGKPNENNYLCAIANVEKAVSTFISENPNIKNVRVMLDKSSFVDKRTNQLVDAREVAFFRINRAVGTKTVSVTKKYPKGVDLNKDFQSAKTNSKANDKSNDKDNSKAKSNGKNNDKSNDKPATKQDQGYEIER